MDDMNQRKALGISLKVFAILVIAVCLLYQIITPSVEFANMWFSYLVGMVIFAIGLLMTSV